MTDAPSAILSRTRHILKDLLYTPVEMFVANGLLVSSSSTRVQQKDLPTQLKFVPNGLLSESGTTAITNDVPSHDSEIQVPFSMLIESLVFFLQLTHFDFIASKGLSFVSNGLLSSHSSNSVAG